MTRTAPLTAAARRRVTRLRTNARISRLAADCAETLAVIDRHTAMADRLDAMADDILAGRVSR